VVGRSSAFLPGIVDWIRIFNALGFLVVVVTNQRGCGAGLDPWGRSGRDPSGCGKKWRAPARVLAISSAARMKKAPAVAASPGQAWCSRRKGGGISSANRDLASACGMSFIRAREGRIVEVLLNGSI
jgi:hypothetical protein